MASLKPSPLFVGDDSSIGSCVVCQLALCLTVYQLKCRHRICGRCNIKYTQGRTKDTNCPGNGSQCSTTCINNSNHKWEDKAINNALLEEEVPCERCGKPVKRKSLTEHKGGEGCLTAKEKEQKVGSEVKEQDVTAKSSDIIEHDQASRADRIRLDSLQDAATQLLQHQQRLEADIKALQNENKDVRRKYLCLESIIESMKRNCATLDELTIEQELLSEQLNKWISALSRNTIVLKKLSQLSQEIHFKPFIWKIDIKFTDAFDISDSFYLPQFGWRMALVRMCYSNEEHRKFMTVHLFIFKGETYIQNSPPLRGVVNLSLLGQCTSPEHLQENQGHGQSISPEHPSENQGHDQDGSLSKCLSICFSEDALIPEPLVVAEEKMQSNRFCREGFVYIQAEVTVNSEVDSEERSTEVKTFPETGEFTASSQAEVEAMDH